MKRCLQYFSMGKLRIQFLNQLVLLYPPFWHLYSKHSLWQFHSIGNYGILYDARRNNKGYWTYKRHNANVSPNRQMTKFYSYSKPVRLLVLHEAGVVFALQSCLSLWSQIKYQQIGFLFQIFSKTRNAELDELCAGSWWGGDVNIPELLKDSFWLGEWWKESTLEGEENCGYSSIGL